LDFLLRNNGEVHIFEAKTGHGISREQSEKYSSKDAIQVGVFALSGAGPPNDLVTNEPLETITIPKNFYKPSIITIQVRGKSMEPLIRNGAYVGIDRDDKWIVSGEIYAVWLPYEGAIIKRLYLDMEKITLRSDNQQFPDIHVSLQGPDENFIQGRVKWVIQML
jgi:phage repressor protein C with HTH and peptisase S24 domain